jgi:diaminopimelate epimerase
MRIRFTKMQGLGNDFVVLDETRERLPLQACHYRFMADRHFGIGADQILTLRPSPASGIDFEYVIHNANGDEVAQCGNGARCLARFVYEQGLSRKPQIRVQTQNSVLQLSLQPDGQVTVDMGRPRFELADVGFDASGLVAKVAGDCSLWPLVDVGPHAQAPVWLALVSMGNPHAVQLVADVDAVAVPTVGAQIERHRRFVHRVNAGFMQVVDRSHIRLRVFERGVGETLACGSGACAAVVAGIRQGLLDQKVQVQTRGGALTIAWAGHTQPVQMTGPARTVFYGDIDLPENL